MPIPQEKKVFVGWASCPSYFRTGKMPIPQEKKVFVGWASCPSYFRTGKMPVPQEEKKFLWDGQSCPSYFWTGKMPVPQEEKKFLWDGHPARPNYFCNKSMESRIQAYLRFAASQQRDTEHIGPFLATFSPHTTNPYLNYAIPEDGATPSLADVNALIAAYSDRDRQPRLEYVTKLAPAVEEALISAGFTVEGRLPLMICTPGSEKLLPIPPEIELILPVSDDELLGTVAAQNEAYGEAAPSPEDVDSLRKTLAAGGIAVLARVAATGEPAGAGICTPPQNQTTEIAGIGVPAAFRRRGIAGALTARLLREAFDAGVTVAFLMTLHEQEFRVYTRAGFSAIGSEGCANDEILHISLPPQ
ncbi:MAG: GNAT family N-acetyltransferase [Oscillatoriales cyanobacterium]|nr:MAG: GNAT family N-acetyltransferase [Oscillatoriales cyanobacterium]